MSNEAGSSTQAVYNEVKISSTKEKALKNLLDCVINLDNSHKFSPIYTVPSRLRDVDPSSFIPRVVSIGPLHKGRINLKSMEKRKATSLSELLSSIPRSPEETLKDSVQKVTDSIVKIKKNYFGMEKYDDYVLVQMMVMDACFILHFIDNLSIMGNLFSNNRLRSRNIALDLVMLENQIPFFVLQDIYDLTLRSLRPDTTLITMLSALLQLVNPFEEPLIDENVGTDSTPHHILGLLHKFYQRLNFTLPIIEAVPTAYSAVELEQVGVKIKANKSLTWPMAMEFKYSVCCPNFVFPGPFQIRKLINKVSSHKPTLKMPGVRIDNFFEVVLRNLIAYEQYSPVDNHVTSYAMAMHMLAATPADIAKLGKSGVIVSHLGSNEKASEMISSICKNVNLQDFYYSEAWTNIAEYYESVWLRNLAVFKQTYIDTPWKAIALFAAVTVFLITVFEFFRQSVFQFL